MNFKLTIILFCFGNHLFAQSNQIDTFLLVTATALSLRSEPNVNSDKLESALKNDLV